MCAEFFTYKGLIFAVHYMKTQFVPWSNLESNLEPVMVRFLHQLGVQRHIFQFLILFKLVTKKEALKLRPPPLWVI